MQEKEYDLSKRLFFTNCLSDYNAEQESHFSPWQLITNRVPSQGAFRREMEALVYPGPGA